MLAASRRPWTTVFRAESVMGIWDIRRAGGMRGSWPRPWIEAGSVSMPPGEGASPLGSGSGSGGLGTRDAVGGGAGASWEKSGLGSGRQSSRSVRLKSSATRGAASTPGILAEQELEAWGWERTSRAKVELAVSGSIYKGVRVVCLLGWVWVVFGPRVGSICQRNMTTGLLHVRPLDGIPNQKRGGLGEEEERDAEEWGKGHWLVTL